MIRDWWNWIKSGEGILRKISRPVATLVIIVLALLLVYITALFLIAVGYVIYALGLHLPLLAAAGAGIVALWIMWTFE